MTQPDDHQDFTGQTELDSEIRKLVAMIQKLMPLYPSGWVSWRKVVKEQKGSEEFEPMLSRLAQLEEWNTSSRRMVRSSNSLQMGSVFLRLNTVRC